MRFLSMLRRKIGIRFGSVSSEGGGGTPPILFWASNATTLDPVFDWTELTTGDIAELEIHTNASFIALYDSDMNTVDAGEAATGVINFSGIMSLANSTQYWARGRYTRGGITSAWSNSVTLTTSGV